MSSKKRSGQFLKGLTSFRVGPEVEPLVRLEFLEALDCPRALTVQLLLKYGEYEQLSALEFNPLWYNSTADLSDAYAATKFMSKYRGFSRELDLDEVALKKFEQFELLCKQTNSRFRRLSTDPLYRGSAVWLHHAITRKISSVLGDFDTSLFFSLPDWGPGATTRIKRRFASAPRKFQFETGITRDLHSLLPLSLILEVYPLWGAHLAEMAYPAFEVGNRVTTVPKDSSTNRVIAVEPGINLFFQMSIGRSIGLRLRRCGIDLRKQENNQRLAKVGSKTSHLTTVDLSSASDSIATEVVRELIPPLWFNAMDASRSHFGTLRGSLLRWEKFSSMGNGFTFQLESLIFYAVAFCCTEYLGLETFEVSAYGDDVILPSAAFELFSEMMDFYGFRVNYKKSHKDSFFRESCGAHYFFGVDVKPIYLKDRLSSIQSVYRLANSIRRLANRRLSGLACDGTFYRVHHRLISETPSALRLRIPETLGDGGFISNFDESVPSRCRNGVEGYSVCHLVEMSQTHQMTEVGYLLSNLWDSEESEDDAREDLCNRSSGSRAILEAIRHPTRRLEVSARKNSVPLLGKTRLKVVESVVQQWRDLGPWI